MFSKTLKYFNEHYCFSVEQIKIHDRRTTLWNITLLGHKTKATVTICQFIIIYMIGAVKASFTIIFLI